MASMNDFLSSEDLQKIQKSIAPYVPPTPLVFSFYLSAKYQASVYLKLENLNQGGSFKIRGAASSLLSKDLQQLKQRGVVTASAGNHAQAVAYMSHALGIPATIFMPKHTPMIKVSGTRDLGADIYIEGDHFYDSQLAAHRWNKDHGAVYVHGFQDFSVVAGQASVGLEIVQQLPDVDAIIAPVGGGGLISGIIHAVRATRSRAVIYGVQSALCCPVSQSYRSDVFPCALREAHAFQQDALKGASLADGIAIKKPCDNALRLIQSYVDHMFCVSEQAVAGAIMELLERDHLIAEGAGAASVAALERAVLYKQEALRGRKIVCVVSGGNIDVSLLGRITQKGLLYSHRMLHVKLLLEDHPGALSQCLDVVSQMKGNLYNIYHNRMFSKQGIQHVEVSLELEISGLEHGKQLVEKLIECGYTPQVL